MDNFKDYFEIKLLKEFISRWLINQSNLDERKYFMDRKKTVPGTGLEPALACAN